MFHKKILHRVGSWLHGVFEEEKRAGQNTSIKVLDGVRACAILLVIAFHINYTTHNNLWDWHTNPLASSLAVAGVSGVNLFFVLSGFLLFLPYAKALLSAGRRPLARSFYVRRAWRIMPGYYFSLFVLILLTSPKYLRPENWDKLALFVTFLMDSSRSTFRLLNGPYWTLAVEWQFYMLLPLLMLGIFWLVRHVPVTRRLRAVVLCLCGVIAAGLLIRYAGLYLTEHPTDTLLIPRSFLNVLLFFSFGIVGKYLEEFAVGMFCSLLYVYAQTLTPEHSFVQRLRRLSPWFWGAGVLIWLFCAMWNFQANPATPAWSFLDPLMPYFTWLDEMGFTIAYGLGILAILFGAGEVQRIFAWRPLRWLGLISYSLYIWHLPLLTFGHYLMPGFDHWNKFAIYGFDWAWMVLAIVPFCILLYALVERPGMKRGDIWRKALEARYRAKQQKPEESGYNEQNSKLSALTATGPCLQSASSPGESQELQEAGLLPPRKFS